jgi:hypothetical protein
MHVFKIDWTTCSKNANHSRFTSQHNWRELSDLLMSMRIFTLTMIEEIHMSSKNYEANGYGMIEICLLSHTNCVFHVPQEVGAKRKVSK